MRSFLEKIKTGSSAGVSIISCISVIALYMTVNSLILKGLLFLLFYLLNFLAGVKIRPLRTLFTVIFVVLVFLPFPDGKVLFELGSFAVTEGALLSAMKRVLLFLGLIAISEFFFHGIDSAQKLGSSGAGAVFHYFNRFRAAFSGKSSLSFKNAARNFAQILSAEEHLLLDPDHTCAPEVQLAEQAQPRAQGSFVNRVKGLFAGQRLESLIFYAAAVLVCGGAAVVDRFVELW